jgi:hypothetical protein
MPAHSSGLYRYRSDCALIWVTRLLPGRPCRNRSSRCSGVRTWSTQLISVPPEDKVIHRVSGRLARARPMPSAWPGSTWSRMHQSVQPRRSLLRTPVTRSPKAETSVRYRRAIVRSETPITSANSLNGARGAITRA